MSRGEGKVGKAIFIYFFLLSSFMYDVISAMLIKATLSLRHLLTLAVTDHKVLNSFRHLLN